jgi:type IV pilus assembly protein PilY1
VLVYPPPLSSSDTTYQAFKAANATRTSIILIGANDGMLHAFRASDGVELWAFIPPALLGTLKNLKDAVGTHGFYVDSSPIVADVKISGTWKTIAVFGLRRGGNTYYALDITDTTNPGYLWSYTETEMGETWSEPAIGKVKMQDGTTKYVAFVGGGYHTTANNTKGRAFYVIDLTTGTLLWKYATEGAADKAYMNFSIAATPTAADLNDDGFIDRVYVGDVGGQLWKFDTSAPATLSGGLVTNWTGKRLFAGAPTQTNPPPSGAYYPAQGIYATPVLAYDASGSLWVYFGTGDRNNPRRDSSNRVYAIKDNTDMTNGSFLRESDLVNTESGNPVTQGWYYLLDANEKVWMPAEVYNQVVYFSTYTPLNATDVCDNGSGYSRLYSFQMTNGHVGLDWDTGHGATDTDGTEDRFIQVGTGAPSRPAVVLGTANDGVAVGTTDGSVTNIELPPTATKRLRYWREVF